MILEFFRNGKYQFRFNYMSKVPSAAQLQRDIALLLRGEPADTRVCITGH